MDFPLSFLIWALPTCLLEGRAHVLLEMDPLERAFCTLIAKSLIGTMGTVRLFRYLMTSQFIRLEQIGLRRPARALSAASLPFLLEMIHLTSQAFFWIPASAGMTTSTTPIPSAPFDGSIGQTGNDVFPEDRALPEQDGFFFSHVDHRRG